MKWMSSWAFALALMCAPAVSAAQTPTPDPVKLDLARQLMDVSGARENSEKMLASVYESMDAAFAGAIPAKMQPLMKAMQRDIRAETAGMLPTILNQSVEIYARILTEQELREMLAWSSSPTGRAIAAKQPLIMQEIMRAQIPYMQEMMPRMMRKAMDRACDEAKCSAAERREVATFMQQALGKKPS